VRADPRRLEQVVVNLLSNATKYTDPGGAIRLTVGRDGEAMVLRVRDTGLGIDPELLPHVFDLFVQADRSLDRSRGGMGIGLTLVRRLVELHRGTVDVHSAGLGQGSEFVVRLPVEMPPSRPSPSPPPPPTRPAAPPTRVLLVDDNVDYAKGLATLLRASGYEIRVAHSGSTALEAMGAERPDVLVLDIGLPEMDGYEVARRVRQDPELRRLRIVGLSGYRPESDSPLARAARFDSYLLKPVRIEELKAHLGP
jgi:CheY-like chemotaxis protein